MLRCSPSNSKRQGMFLYKILLLGFPEVISIQQLGGKWRPLFLLDWQPNRDGHFSNKSAIPSNLCVGSFDAGAKGRAARPDAGRGSLSDSVRLVTEQQHKYNTITSPTVILISFGVASSATALLTSRFYTANSFCLTCLKKNLILY